MTMSEPIRIRRARLAWAWALVVAAPLCARAAPEAAPAAGAQGGQQVVEAVCIKCHGTGANGAPKIGDQANWSKRAAQGLTSLTRHALDGIRRMPAHGGNPNLTDLEISRAITYMVNRSGGHWIEPVSVNAPAAERGGEQVVKSQCVKCHEAGLNGAPRIGDRQAWLPRMKNGVDYLVRSAVHGHGGMPPRGGEADLTDAELRGAILYMFDPKYATSAEAARAAGKAAPPSSEKAPNHARAGNLDVFLGIVSAQSLLSYPSGSAERSMHGGVPTGPDYYHLNVSLQDHASQAPITDAQVAVQIEQAGGADRASRTLEPIPYAASYGNYVQFKRNTPYVIIVQVRTASAPGPLEARFEQTFY
jgi:cytochrome c5